MSNRCTRSLSALALVFFLAAPLVVHGAEVPLLRGQLIDPSNGGFEGLFVGLSDTGNHNEIHRVDVTPDGSFQLRSVPPGEYVMSVTDMLGHTVAQQFVTVYEHQNELTVRLPPSERRPSAPGTISVTQLRHPPTKKAVQAFSVASRLASSGKYGEAVTELEKAIRISPEFGQAYTNLAVQHIRLQRFQEAADESVRAMQIGGPDPVNLCNLAFAQYQLRHLEEAAVSARAALRLDAGYRQADLVLGAILGSDPRMREEAIYHLERAAEQFPSARVNLERLRGAR